MIHYSALFSLAGGIILLCWSVAHVIDDASHKSAYRLRRFFRNDLLVFIATAFVLTAVILSFLSTGISQKSTLGFAREGVNEVILSGSVQVKDGQAAFYPDPGQAIGNPILLIMMNVPLNGSAQQHFDAAAQYFQSRQTHATISGQLQPFGNGQILAVTAINGVVL